MKWRTKQIFEGDTRIIWDFIWFPKSLQRQNGEWETRWFELTKIVQVRRSGGTYDDDYWENVSWAN
jgi:hypothetical protein